MHKQQLKNIELEINTRRLAEVIGIEDKTKQELFCELLNHIILQTIVEIDGMFDELPPKLQKKLRKEIKKLFTKSGKW